MTGSIVIEKRGAVGWLVLENLTRHNAITTTMWKALPGTLDELAKVPGVRVIVVRGAGDRAFSAGADISEFEQERGSGADVSRYDEMAQRATAALAGCRLPTIAMIRGYCMGGGLETALNCDLRIAAADAQFAIPAGRVGLGYGFERTRRLVECIGAAYAKEMLFTTRRYDAAAALHMGLINRVVSIADLLAVVESEAEGIAANAPLTVAAAKVCVDELQRDETMRDLDACRSAVAACFESEDYVEGRRAFADKRLPTFRGK